MFRKLVNDESGVVISAELVLVLTIAVISMVVGLSEVTLAVNTELNDISNAIGSLSQSYALTAFHDTSPKTVSNYGGSLFVDGHDDGDQNTTCDIVCGFPNCGSQPTCG